MMQRLLIAMLVAAAALTAGAQDAPKDTSKPDTKPVGSGVSWPLYGDVATTTKPAGKDQPGKVEIPVTRVVMFSSGVGYFEHNGTVDGDANATLMFKTDEMNDVLKSMVLMDLDKGTVNSIKFPSRDPISHALKSFGVDVSGNPTVADLLKQLRGVEVVVMAPEKITGKVLTVETKERQVVANGVTTIIKEDFLNLVTDKGIVAIPMSSIASVTIANQRLSDELNKALELLIESRDMSRKQVDIQFTGKGKRRVMVGYVTETPIWKTSYRLDLSGKEAVLQGWAIVENTTDQDWNGVKLSLVSGRPISFIQDLYTPLYMPRPVVVPELYASLRPQVYEDGVQKERDRAAENQGQAKAGAGYGGRNMALKEAKDESAAGMAMPAAAATPAAPGATYEEYLRGGVDIANSVQSAASAAKMGELFNFTIKDPVDLQRRRSAMLPIVNSPVKAEKVSIYNQSVLAKNPLNGAYLTNTTDIKLPGGPVTVFDDGAYAGDAQLDNFVPGDKRLISYAIDLNVVVDPSVKEDTTTVGLKIVRGAMEYRQLRTYTQTYAIKNKADQKRTVIIEHPFFAERKLVKPEKFEEKTPKMYRFRTEVDKGSTQDFQVVEEQTVVQQIGILGESVETLVYYAKTGKMSPKVAEALAKAIELKQKSAQLEIEYRDVETQLNRIKAGQERLNRNLASVGKETELGRTYLAKFAAEEVKIDKYEKQLEDLQTSKQAAQKALEDFLKDLTIE